MNLNYVENAFVTLISYYRECGVGGIHHIFKNLTVEILLFCYNTVYCHRLSPEVAIKHTHGVAKISHKSHSLRREELLRVPSWIYNN